MVCSPLPVTVWWIFSGTVWDYPINRIQPPLKTDNKISASPLNHFLLQVFDLSDGSLLSVIDSHGSKLKRPTGLAVSLLEENFCYVVDIGHDCVRKYRYK